MSIKQISRVWELSPYKSSRLLIHLAIADHMDDDGLGFASWKQLQQKARTGRTTVYETIQKMITDGYLLVVEKSSQHAATVYQMLWPNTNNSEVQKPDPAKSGVQSPDPSDNPGVQFAASEVQSLGPHPSYTSKRNPKKGFMVGDASADNPVAKNPPQQAIDLAELLAELIRANGSKSPKVTKRWVTDLDLMHRADNRTWNEIAGAIRWSQQDSFWRANILSPAKLREKFDQMRLQGNRETGHTSTPSKTERSLGQIAQLRAQEQAATVPLQATQGALR